MIWKDNSNRLQIYKDFEWHSQLKYYESGSDVNGFWSRSLRYENRQLGFINQTNGLDYDNHSAARNVAFCVCL
jgi:hypothetical protein